MVAREHELARTEADIARRKAELADIEEERRRVLEQVAGLTAAEAKAELVKDVESQAKRDAALIVRDIEAKARNEGEDRARRIVTLAIQRVASEQTAESVVSVLHLPSDDMKGRIIGREGRNIRAYEAVTGVNVVIDDTPEAVLLSCFDPVRREVGRVTLEALVLDGRIHPQRIEEEYERAKVAVEALCVRAGEDALVEVGIARDAPRGDHAARPAALPHQLRPERPRASHRVGPSRRDHGRRAAAAARPRQARHACCTTSARRSPMRSKAATR